jgi:hypothetical protein
MVRPSGRGKKALWALVFAGIGALDIALNLSMLVAVKGLDTADVLNIAVYLALGALSIAAGALVARGKGPLGVKLANALTMLSAGWLAVAAVTALSWAAWGFHDPLYSFLFGTQPPPGPGLAAWLGGSAALSLATLYAGRRAALRWRSPASPGAER